MHQFLCDCPDCLTQQRRDHYHHDHDLRCPVCQPNHWRENRLAYMVATLRDLLSVATFPDPVLAVERDRLTRVINGDQP